jgi:hypothetical protein
VPAPHAVRCARIDCGTRRRRAATLPLNDRPTPQRSFAWQSRFALTNRIEALQPAPVFRSVAQFLQAFRNLSAEFLLNLQ